MPLQPSPSVLLVNYAGYVLTGNTFVPDNSLATLAGSLRAHGIAVRILDFQNPHDIGAISERAGRRFGAEILERLGSGAGLDRELYRNYLSLRDRDQLAFEQAAAARVIAACDEQNATLVGFKLWAGNGLSGSIKMAEALRAARPELGIVAGGPAVTLSGRRLLTRTRAFDHLVSGDGEQAIVALATGSAGSASEQVVQFGQRLRRGGGIGYTGSLDALAPPDYSADVYPGLERMFALRVLDESRGCFNHCAFCAHPALNGVTRKKSPGRISDEIETALAQGVRTFRFSGSNPPWKFLSEVAREIRARRLPIRFSAYSSMNNVRAADLPALAEAGLSGLFFGIESGDPAILERAHRKDNVGPEHVVSVVQAALRAGVFVCLSVIAPSPFETADSQERTFELLCRALDGSPLGSVIVMPPFLLPGSAWWAEPSRFGFARRPGFDEDRLLDHLLDWNMDFLLPRELAPDAGYELCGKSSNQLFEESAAFSARLERAGICTNVDDATFMIAASGGLPAAEYKREMMRGLVLGGSERLKQWVSSVRNPGEPASLLAG